MRVLFDGFWFHRGPPSQRHVLREMTSRWNQLFPEDTLALLVRKKHHEVAILDKGRISAEFFETSLYPHALAVTVGMQRAIRSFSPDVVLNHNFSVPSSCLSATYLHDLLFLDHPEWFTPAERLYFQGMPLSARWADVVYASTESEATRIRRHIPTADVVPVGLGISSELTDAMEDRSILPQLGIESRQFILTVGRLNSRKNVATSIEAFLQSSLPECNFKMVVVGEPNGKDAQFSHRVEQAVANDIIKFAGKISDADLKALYRSAKAFIFLSLGEGYGMPPVEAAYFECPQILSDLRVFRENLGDYPVYVDPMSVEQASSALNQTATQVEADRGQAPHEWLQTHNWDLTVRKIRSDIAERLVRA